MSGEPEAHAPPMAKGRTISSITPTFRSMASTVRQRKLAELRAAAERKAQPATFSEGVAHQKRRATGLRPEIEEAMTWIQVGGASQDDDVTAGAAPTSTEIDSGLLSAVEMRARVQSRTGPQSSSDLGEQIRKAEEGMGMAAQPISERSRRHGHDAAQVWHEELRQQVVHAQRTRETLLREAAMAAALSAGIFNTDPNEEAVAMRAQMQRRRRGRSDLSEQIAAVERELGLQGTDRKGSFSKNGKLDGHSSSGMSIEDDVESDEAALHLSRLLQSVEWVDQAANWPPLMAIRLRILARLQGGVSIHLAHWKASVLLSVATRGLYSSEP